MGIGGEHMDRLTVEEGAGAATGLFAPESGERVGGYLDEAASFDPLGKTLKIFLQVGVALGVGNHRGDSHFQQAKQGRGDLLGNGVIAELDEEIAGVADGVAVGVGEGVLEVVVGEVEIASQSEMGRVAGQLAKPLETGGQFFPMIGVLVIGVGGGDDVLNAVLSGQPAHFQGHVPGGGAVIHFGDDVTVNVNHDVGSERAQPGADACIGSMLHGQEAGSTSVAGARNPSFTAIL